jgi:very-short-patch-repair endonuclease
MEKRTTESFIEESKKIHGDIFDYSDVIYDGLYKHVKIKCKAKGHVFEQTPKTHLRCKGCPICKGGKSLTTEQIIEKCKAVHGDKFDYSLTEFINHRKKIKIICLKHGVIEVTIDYHLKSKTGCYKCGNEQTALKLKKTTQEFIKQASEIHKNKYLYTKTNYINNASKIIIICPIHGDFEQVVSSHLMGNGCPKCADILNGLKKRKTTEQFIEDSIKIFGDRYGYDKVEYTTGDSEVLIFCKKHNYYFKIIPYYFLSGSGCPKCTESKGERKISDFLDKNKIEYKSQKSFNECKNIAKLLFDFYIKDKNLLIEYDGELHFKEIEAFGGKKALENTKKRDAIKTKFAKDNGIKLLRIKYTEFKNIEDILRKELL